MQPAGDGEPAGADGEGGLLGTLSRTMSFSGNYKFREDESSPLEPDEWVADDDAEACKACNEKFTVFTRRRHHCRGCGDIFW